MHSPDSFLTCFEFPYTFFDKSRAISLYKPRDPFAHKGNFGHALLLAGSYGKIGAAVLASKACLSSGAGLLTAHVPSCGYEIMQTALPEAMVDVDTDPDQLTECTLKPATFQAAGIGPGIGTSISTVRFLKKFIKKTSIPIVLDADALNILGKNPEFLSTLPVKTILTPHPKEFDRMFGQHSSDLDRLRKARKVAIQYKIIVVLKGHFTGVFYPDGQVSFNTSGNAGMAKGGSGDVLTGIITAFLAQGYKSEISASLAVYLHGCAGDLAAKLYSEEAMLPSDLIHCLGKIFLEWKESVK